MSTIILIDGPPASGKTTLARAIAAGLNPGAQHPLWHPNVLRHPPVGPKEPVRIVDNLTTEQVVRGAARLRALAEVSNVLIVTVSGKLDEASCREVSGGRFTVHLVEPTLCVPARP